MADLHQRIEELEAKAAEFKLIADLATDPEARANNARRAEGLLLGRLPPAPNPGSCANAA
jgi:hypothetical protein